LSLLFSGRRTIPLASQHNQSRATKQQGISQVYQEAKKGRDRFSVKPTPFDCPSAQRHHSRFLTTPIHIPADRPSYLASSSILSPGAGTARFRTNMTDPYALASRSCSACRTSSSPPSGLVQRPLASCRAACVGTPCASATWAAFSSGGSDSTPPLCGQRKASVMWSAWGMQRVNASQVRFASAPVELRSFY
jgi:hypothetical protein